MHGALVLKAHIDRLIAAGAENFNKIHEVPGSFRETIEGTAMIAANGGLVALGFREAQRGRNAFTLLCPPGTSMGPDAELMGFRFRFG